MPQASRILIVEDDLATRQSLALVFQSVGYQVEEVASGQDAIELLRSQDSGAPFEVVLSDISLGDADGIAVLKAARASSGRPEVVLITGYSTVQTAVEALREGAYDYLFKPCDLNSLLETVRRAVNHRQAEQEREQALQTISLGLMKLRALEQPAESVQQPKGNGAGPPRDGRFITLGPLQLDVFTRVAFFDGRPLHLTPTEYTLLLSLGEAPGKVQTYGELVKKVYGHGADERHARLLLKGHVHNLRAKLSPELIQATRGIGYMLTPPGE